MLLPRLSLLLLLFGFVPGFPISVPELELVGYFGGTEKESGNAITVDGAGNIYIVGQTNSPDFPSTPDAVRTRSTPTKNDWVGFAVKFRRDDKKAMYSAIIGGSYRTVANGVAADSSGNAVIVGTTCSADFSTTSHAFQRKAPGGGRGLEGCDAYVAKLDPTGSRFVYSTYLGGSAGDTATSVAIDRDGNIWVAGFTSSPDFPVSPDAQQPQPGGQTDGFLVKLDANGAFRYGTFIGGSEDDFVHAIAFGSRDLLFLAGGSSSATFLRCATRRELAAFVLPFRTSGPHRHQRPTLLSGPEYSTAVAIAASPDNRVAVVGSAVSKQALTTPDAYQRQAAGATAAYWAELGLNPKTGDLQVIYASLFGGSGETSADAVSLGRDNVLYVAGRTTVRDLPLTAGALFTTVKGNEDAYLLRCPLRGKRPDFVTYLGTGGALTYRNVGAKGLAVDGNLVHITGMANNPILRGRSGPLRQAPRGNTEMFIIGLRFQESSGGHP